MERFDPRETLDNFREFLKTGGMKITSQRLTLVDKLLEMKGHHSADDMIDMLKTEGLKVSKATLYRILALLKQSGCFNEHDFGIGKKFYEFTRGRKHHDHFYCVGCGKVMEFRDSGIEKIQKTISRKHHFTPLYHSHNIYGYCSRCSARTRQRVSEKSIFRKQARAK